MLRFYRYIDSSRVREKLKRYVTFKSFDVSLISGKLISIFENNFS